jgi:hypothetical protein
MKARQGMMTKAKEQVCRSALTQEWYANKRQLDAEAKARKKKMPLPKRPPTQQLPMK